MPRALQPLVEETAARAFADGRSIVRLLASINVPRGAASRLQLHGFQLFIELNIQENAAKMIGRFKDETNAWAARFKTTPWSGHTAAHRSGQDS